MTPQPKPRLTAEEYLAFERRAEGKHEFLNGEIFAMSGAGRRHGLVALNVAALLHAQLKGRSCEVFASDMRVQVKATGLYTYPDVVVVCGEPQFADAELDTLLNPTLVVEVLSASTESYDRGTKFAHYRTLPSLADYVLFAQDRVHAEHYTRQAEDRWLLTETGDPRAVLELGSIGCRLVLAEVYDEVPLEGPLGGAAPPPAAT
jgi:Uma2 family endonuclease